MTVIRVLCIALVACVVAATANNDTQRIVGGQAAHVGQFPSIVSLRHRNGAHFCGAAIVNVRWVLTAASCVSDGPKAVARNIQAFVGAHTRTDGIAHDITRIVRHPRFDRQSKAFDLAMLNSRTNIVFRAGRVTPCRLPMVDRIGTDNSGFGYFGGWGLLRVRHLLFLSN